MCRHTLIEFITKKIVFLACCGAAFVATAQPATDTVRRARVEKSLWGVQAGVLGIWGYHELRLADQVSLRTELGGNLGLRWGSFSGETAKINVVVAPVITVETRWYYNLIKRMRSSKDITGNSGNFLSLQVGYTHIFYVDDTRQFPAVPLLFSWGIRRNIGHHINYEVGILAGAWLLPTAKSVVSSYLYPHLRIGYRF